MKIIRIIRSRLFRKKDQPQFYYDRLKVCDTCEYNSVNKEMTFKEKFYYLVNSLKPFCTICKCQLEAKASEPRENCGMVNLGKESKWIKIKLQKNENNK